MNENRFYICKRCGNLVGLINESGAPLMCCGEKMAKLEAGTVEASVEKHVPVVKVEGDTVKVEVGSAAHPMTEEHRTLLKRVHTAQKTAFREKPLKRFLLRWILFCI